MSASFKAYMAKIHDPDFNELASKCMFYAWKMYSYDLQLWEAEEVINQDCWETVDDYILYVRQLGGHRRNNDDSLLYITTQLDVMNTGLLPIDHVHIDDDAQPGHIDAGGYWYDNGLAHDNEYIDIDFDAVEAVLDYEEQQNQSIQVRYPRDDPPEYDSERLPAYAPRCPSYHSTFVTQSAVINDAGEDSIAAADFSIEEQPAVASLEENIEILVETPTMTEEIADIIMETPEIEIEILQTPARITDAPEIIVISESTIDNVNSGIQMKKSLRSRLTAKLSQACHKLTSTTDGRLSRTLQKLTPPSSAELSEACHKLSPKRAVRRACHFLTLGRC
ncbi:hypothetical protein F5Y16DRAFT_401463 [Xylariaceae sp. FL0255]|nr:hypothetical protein F5Y16DRAFT_401463 [Xylariaceae sp. FL0255]